ncbi:glycoside hydrolase family 3 protein [Halovulum dunhuangense]|uniref:beta-N-acetylhexosaminidase n=1 Tax=Halovulum dunhuangense TaxID=1505036 RepID=A0A849L1P7_9RHOB|nr:glycoside hydrolase family 3 protein [Halovulum dunhuangense]NNU80216.1 glycoside hydrolase family 3 protein [Halovulum dunhuangense]
MAPRSVIYGLSGTALSDAEARFFRESDPWGFILFARNIDAPDQVRRLVDDLRDAVGRRAPVLIDQEGGRVARLTPPVWTGWEDALPFLSRLPEAARAEAMRLRYHVIGAELAALGIDVNCAPMADVAQPDTHPVVRTRCYATTPSEVARLARAVADGLALGGVLPVLKHIPGHGRTPLDSHVDLPVVAAPREVLETEDFAPFQALADLPLGMTAHVVYPALDPDRCATMSPVVLDKIRAGIGFDGLLMSDDISMGALSGGYPERSAAALSAGCDLILHCNGRMSEMEEVAAACAPLSDDALRRHQAVMAARAALAPQPVDIPVTLARIAALAGTEARDA